MNVQFLVHKGILDKCLTIIKDTIHLDGCNILTQSSKLALLNRAYLALGVQDINMNTFYTQKSIGNSRTGISTGGNQHVDSLFSLFLQKVLQ